jgi:hypothetical protein
MKKHDITMIAAWARDWGIPGYEHLDPKVRELRRIASLKKQRDRKEDDRKHFSKK